jgi:hypothetical protein
VVKGLAICYRYKIVTGLGKTSKQQIQGCYWARKNTEIDVVFMSYCNRGKNYKGLLLSTKKLTSNKYKLVTGLEKTYEQQKQKLQRVVTGLVKTPWMS